MVRLALLIQPRQPGLSAHRCGFDMRQERARPHACGWAEEVEAAGADRGQGGHREGTA